MRTIEFWKEAAEELLEAVKWYEERGEGLGREFLRSLDVCLSTIQRYPTLYPAVHRNVRRSLLRKFPYGLYYVFQEQQIVVIAVIHTSRDSGLLEKRLT